MNLLMIVSLLGFLGIGQGGSLAPKSSHVLLTSTLRIATQTFLDELSKTLLGCEGTKQKDTGCGIGGALYTRWGRKDCPSGSRLVYTGSTAGTHSGNKAGPANTLCLPKDPEYGNYTTGRNSRGYIMGTEYQTANQLPEYNHLFNQDVPCAVCETRANTKILMIPAKRSCPKGWRLEYNGYLMAGKNNHASSDYLCVDGQAQPLDSGHEHKSGHLLYLVEGLCGSLQCPPYKQARELTCAVCSH